MSLPTLAELRAIEQRATELLARSAALVVAATAPTRVVRETVRHRLAVSIQVASANSKLSPVREEIANSGRTRYVPTGPFVTSSYVSIAATCPGSCPFRSGGCYAIAGASHLTMHKLDAAAKGMTALAVTQAEAHAIDATFVRGVPQDGARGGRDLRLHVGGEVSCAEGAAALADAADRWRARGGGATWTFTHRWAEIPRARWGSISVLASVQTPDEAEAARAAGYVPAITVQRFTGRRVFELRPGLRVIPCPSEASEGRITCSRCRLCLDDGALRRRGLAIAFALHGQDAELAMPHAHALIRLPVIP